MLEASFRACSNVIASLVHLAISESQGMWTREARDLLGKSVHGRSILSGCRRPQNVAERLVVTVIVDCCTCPGVVLYLHFVAVLTDEMTL